MAISVDLKEHDLAFINILIKKIKLNENGFVFPSESLLKYRFVDWDFVKKIQEINADKYITDVKVLFVDNSSMTIGINTDIYLKEIKRKEIKGKLQRKIIVEKYNVGKIILVSFLGLMMVSAVIDSGRSNSYKNDSNSLEITSNQKSALYNLIRNAGYQCKRMDSAIESGWDGSYSIWCDDFKYYYTVEDVGGRWAVTVN